jgi:hypothetical protein
MSFGTAAAKRILYARTDPEDGDERNGGLRGLDLDYFPAQNSVFGVSISYKRS